MVTLGACILVTDIETSPPDSWTPVECVYCKNGPAELVPTTLVPAPAVNYLSDAVCASLDACKARCFGLTECRGVATNPFRLLLSDGPNTAVNVQYARCGTRQLPCPPAVIRFKVAASTAPLKIWSTGVDLSVVQSGQDAWFAVHVTDGTLKSAIAMPQIVDHSLHVPLWTRLVSLFFVTCVVIPLVTVLSRLTHTTGDHAHLY